LKQNLDRHVDAHGWSPFDEQRFPEALLTSPSLHSLLLVNGGFAAFWKETGLPQESAPGSDSHVVSQERLVALLQAASRARTGQYSAEREKITVAANAMDEMFSPWVASNTNKFAALATHHNDYSGEVSTIDLSTLGVCSEPGQNCSDAGCNMCLTRESYDSSTDRSMLGSLSGYESDTEGLTSDKDSAQPSGIHTPTRLPRPVANDRTPKQNDFAKHTLTQSHAKYMRGSEASEASVTSVGGMSEDEKFAKGII
jgi:hypothetical protein